MAAWTIFGTLLAFKLATTVIILLLVPEQWVIEFFLLLNWFWFIPPVALGLVAGTFWYRMVRVRARRSQLLREEFCLGRPTPDGPGTLAFLRRAAEPRK